jgi:hypothetical protein
MISEPVGGIGEVKQTLLPEMLFLHFYPTMQPFKW